MSEASALRTEELRSVSMHIETRTMIDCPICFDPNWSIFLETKGFRIVQCDGCGLWYVNPQPSIEELARFYATYDDGEQWRQGEEIFNEGICKRITRFISAGSALDVGSGSGNFLDKLRRAGFSVSGVEPSATGSQYAQSQLGIEVFNGVLEDFLQKESNLRFDVITLLNVLEHFRDPYSMLLELKRRMTENAILVIVVPDARFHRLVGIARQLLGSKDPFFLERPVSFLSGFKVPDHLTSFTPRTLDMLLTRCGFVPLLVENAPVVLNPDRVRNVAKRAIYAFGQFLSYATRHRCVWGYSTLIIARKQDSLWMQPKNI